MGDQFFAPAGADGIFPPKGWMYKDREARIESVKKHLDNGSTPLWVLDQALLLGLITAEEYKEKYNALAT